jgi:hypothetical protein
MSKGFLTDVAEGDFGKITEYFITHDLIILNKI